ncbi:MAG: DUF6132 family protein [Cytophagales bacterium]|nr:DUF6132 family protein [Cytophagales bacterium]
MNLIIRNRFTILGLVLGAAAGFLYYYYIGCTSGSCPITSRPINSTLYGAVMGGLFFSTFKKEKSSEKNQ